MQRTLEDLKRESLQIQNACNLSVVVHSFSRAMTRLRELFPNEGTDFFNRHPIALMYGSKIVAMTNCEDILTLERAYDSCNV